ncbi:MAG: phenylacetate--CoA ligase family protein [Spirochaetales bacterium]|nr:phenylacetate--CoA ligase family protein [Spirochaetales bacterium]
MSGLFKTVVMSAVIHQRQFLNPEALKALQRRKLERLVAFARKRSPFFRDLYRNVPERGFALEDLPPVTKRMMLESFDSYVTDPRLTLRDLRRFVTDPANIGKRYLGYVAYHTSGTCGEPAVIVHDERSFGSMRSVHMARGLGHRFRLSATFRRLREPLRIAAVVMDGGLFPGFCGFFYAPRWAGLISDIRIFSLRDPLDRLVSRLEEFRPHVLTGYPSIVAQLAQERLAGRAKILQGTPDDLVACLGESLTAGARSLITKAFPCPLSNVYGAGECMVIAQSCGVCGCSACRSRPDSGKANVMHVNDDMAVFEIVDDEGRPVPPGVRGSKAYVTNLANRVQPFIRYEITDVTSRVEGECSCGRGLPLIGEVTGRTDDPLSVAGRDGGDVLIQPYWLMVPLIGFDEIRDWQVRQTRRNELTVSLVFAPGRRVETPVVEEALRGSLRQSNVDAPLEFHVEAVEAIPADPVTGKIRRIWSAIETS